MGVSTFGEVRSRFQLCRNLEQMLSSQQHLHEPRLAFMAIGNGDSRCAHNGIGLEASPQTVCT
ncbi:hypothetical protein Tsubulata_007238 [Turnera subulata]|uniref:Uncharacterized protein n=1 Tax=Turnera subulata TaxID=218843 RepID=A0A9Q0J9D7_9ROSI|nr:hypothetical protein Tsubulata_007238 [Turnera subulata]